MFFWKHKDKVKTSLQACHTTYIDPNAGGILNNPKNNKKAKSIRTLFLTSSCHQASMCLEASLSFSFFLLFLVNVFSILFLYMAYTEDLTALQQQGKKLAAYAYLTGDLSLREDGNLYLPKSRVIQSPFPLLAAPDCRLYTKCVVKPWNGYDVIQSKLREEEEPIVYITEHGTVYHKNRSCSYLTLSIQAAALDTVGEKRNQSGECYYPCEYCGKQGFITVVFITSYGNRYHTTVQCRGLKRTIKSVPLSQVSGMDPCQKCG